MIENWPWLQIVFWLFIGLCFYIYFGFPILWGILALLKRRKPLEDPAEWPTVTLLIAAYNEDSVITEKLDNSLALDYPKDKLEIIVTSDGSTDKTDEIVNAYAWRGVKLNRVEGRRGKTAAQNNSVQMATGEIIVFSDANGMYRPDAIKKMVRHFQDEKVGTVCGELRYIGGSGEASGEGEGLYWKYEVLLKRLESRVSSLIGANGSIYAVRNEYYVPLDDAAISDLMEPLWVLYQYRRKTVYEPQAVSEETVAGTMGKEFNRKVRIITRAFAGLLKFPGLFNPLRFGLFAVQLISHKLLRWLIPLFMIGALITNFFLLDQKLYQIILGVQGAFYLLAIGGYLADKVHIRIKPLYIAYYFCTINFAALLGVINHFLGRRIVTWETQRQGRKRHKLLPKTGHAGQGAFFNLIAITNDVLCLYMAIWISYIIALIVTLNSGQPVTRANVDIYNQLFWFQAFFLVGMLLAMQLYDFSKNRPSFDTAYNGFFGLLGMIAMTFLAFLVYRVYQGEGGFTTGPGLENELKISRLMLLIYFMVLLFLVLGWRIIFIALKRRARGFATNLLVIGPTDTAEAIRLEIEEYSNLGHRVIGHVNDQVDGVFNKAVLEESLEKAVREQNVNEVIIAATSTSRSDLLEVISCCEEAGMVIRLLPDLYEVIIGRLEMEELAGIPLIELQTSPAAGLYAVMKRFADIAISTLLLTLCIVIPIIPLAAIIIKLTSRGPVFFKQERVGRNNQIFSVLKFRSMVMNAESETGPVLAKSGDTRITWIGRIMRKSRIDEIPQLLNVLVGDMSMVGPRPERLVFVREFRVKNPLYDRRHKIKPGVTGLAQIHGRYDTSMDNKLRYDLAYINNMSLLLDLKIMIKTVKVILTAKGAQ